MKFKIRASAGARTSAAMMGALKLAHMAEMPESEFEETLKDLEGSRLFGLLKAAGAVNLAEFPSARYAARRYAGYNLKLSGGGLPELADGGGDLVGLIQGVGQEKFEACFLRDAAMSDVERAEECDISVADAARLRAFVDRAFIQAEMEGPGGAEAPAAKVYSAVAGVELEDGAPVLGFFHREIWKGRYKVDQDKLAEVSGGLQPEERQGIEKLLKKLEFADKRKTTLYRALELLLDIQAEYLRTGEPGRRRPLSQKTLAKHLEVHPSVLNRLVSNKSLQMPWGTEVPMAVLLPSSKQVNRERLYAIAAERPDLSDERLKAELRVRHGVQLSRRSVAQYRKDIGLAASGRRPGGDVVG